MAFRQLIEKIEEMQQYYNSLYELGLQKKEQIIQNRLNDLTATVNKESKLLKQIAQAEKERQVLLIRFQTERGLRPIPNVTLTEVGRMLFHAEEKQELAAAQRRLADTIASLKPLNELNQQLIQQSLAIVEYSLDLLVGPEEEEVVYKHPGASHHAQKRNHLFDTKA